MPIASGLNLKFAKNIYKTDGFGIAVRAYFIHTNHSRIQSYFNGNVNVLFAICIQDSVLESVNEIIEFVQFYDLAKKNFFEKRKNRRAQAPCACRSLA